MYCITFNEYRDEKCESSLCNKCNPEMEKHKETYKKLCDEGSIQEFIDNERRDRFYYDYE